MKKFVVSWLVMWALSYLCVAVVAPGVGGPPVWASAVEFLGFGVALLAATVFVAWGEFYLKQTLVPNTAAGSEAAKNLMVIGKITLGVLAVLSVYSGIASFTGVFIWVVPYADKAVTQVSMAFLDLVGAAAMIYLALGDVT
jgi:hypothetical protein